MQISNIIIQQANNEYALYTPQGLLIAHIAMPKDGAFLADYKILEVQCKALAMRWGCAPSKGTPKA